MMRFKIDIKGFLFKHVEKLIFGAAICYLVYTIIHAFIILNLKTHEIDAKLLSLSGTLDRKLKTSTPPPIDTERREAAYLELRLTNPPPVSLLQRPQIFSKAIKTDLNSDITIKDLLKKSETQTHARLEITAPGDTEFIFKGGTEELALIQVRKLHKDKWWTESFTVEKGKTIGQKKTVRGETIDFDTDCKLKDIIPLAQKTLVMKKTTALRNEKGEFLGTSFAEETYTISTSRIVFENKKGESYSLWIGELVNLGTETVTVHTSSDTTSTN